MLIAALRPADLVPHAGAMVLLDGVLGWDTGSVRCWTRSHLSATNPLRRPAGAVGRLSAVCGVEYGLQAAALHGALLAGGVAQRAGYVARLRDVALGVPYLDDEALGTLTVEATLERSEANGMLYALALSDAAGRVVVSARAGISLP